MHAKSFADSTLTAQRTERTILKLIFTCTLSLAVNLQQHTNHSSSDLMSLKVTGDQQIDPKKLSFMTWDVYDVWRLCMSHKYTWDKSVVCVCVL